VRCNSINNNTCTAAATGMQQIANQTNTQLDYNRINKKFELMLTKCTQAYSSSC